MRPNDVAQALDLDRIAKDHVWKVEPSCATSGEGKSRVHTHQYLPRTNTNTLHQAFSKASPGSARTSRSRRSKREPISNPTIHSTRPTNAQRHHQHVEEQQHCTTTVSAALLAVFLTPCPIHLTR